MLVGFQHQNENLERDTFIGNISPITGGFITENSLYIFIRDLNGMLKWAL